jgi:hypothetical protein
LSQGQAGLIARVHFSNDVALPPQVGTIILYLGYTDASVIDASGGGGISIDGPPTDFLFLVTETGS